MTRILDIVDNRAEAGLLSEHGLSLLIEHRAQRLLLDTGSGTALEPNAAKLGVDLNGLTRIVLSHSHYDHTGGLSHLRLTCPVHVGEGIAVPSYSKQPDMPKDPCNGFSRPNTEKWYNHPAKEKGSIKCQLTV